MINIHIELFIYEFLSEENKVNIDEDEYV